MANRLSLKSKIWSATIPSLYKNIGVREMNVCVYCSASNLEDKYRLPAIKFAKLLAESGHNLVWGGSNVGLMQDIATSAQDAGAKLIGVSMELLESTARPDADEMIVTKDLGERKAVMVERSDAIVALIGGTGTLDELTDAFEERRHGFNNKPIIVLNTLGFYDGLRQQLSHMQSEHFLDRMRPLEELISFVDEPEDIIALLAQPQAEPEQSVILSAEASAA
jgi:uncharacterized protein (TIGR00730 family)